MLQHEVGFKEIKTIFRVLDPPESSTSWVVNFEENGDVLCPDCETVVNEYDEGRPLDGVERDLDALPRLLYECPDKYGFFFWGCSCGTVVSAFTDCY